MMTGGTSNFLLTSQVHGSVDQVRSRELLTFRARELEGWRRGGTENLMVRKSNGIFTNFKKVLGGSSHLVD